MAVVTLDGGSSPGFISPGGGLGADGFAWVRKTVTTTNATPLDAIDLQRLIADGDTVEVEASIIARSAAGDVKTLRPWALLKNVAGTLEIVASDSRPDLAVGTANTEAWSADISSSGSNVFPRVAGEAAVVITWDCSFGVRHA